MAKDISPPGTNSGTTSDAPSAQAVAGAPISPLANPAPSAGGSVPLFGGHRGGGKKRADGLPAGSAAAIEADRKKDRERKAASNAAKRGASLPPPLPSVPALAASPPNNAPSDAMGGNPSPLCAPVAGVVVPWSIRLLEKPAKLLTRILDRLRCGQIFKKIDASRLPDDVKSEIKKDVPWKDSARDDFAICLAECATIELNKRRVNAHEGHWINLGLSAGELALAHFDLCNRLDKLEAAWETKSLATDETQVKPGV